MRFFHGSGVPHKLGSVIVARYRPTEFFERKLCGGPGVEAFFEEMRPEQMHSRMKAIYMTDHPGLLNRAGADTKYVYEVEPVHPQKHHWSWFSRALSVAGGREASVNRCKRVATEYAKRYWNGTPPPLFGAGRHAVWEYLSPEVRVIAKWRQLQYTGQWIRYKKL